MSFRIGRAVMNTISIEEIINEIKLAFKMQGVAAAITLCDVQLQRTGGDLRLLPLKAQLYANAGNLLGAIAIYDSLIAIHTGNHQFSRQRHALRRQLYLRQHCPGASLHPTIEDIQSDVTAALRDGDCDYAFWALSDLCQRLVKESGQGDWLPSNSVQLDSLCLATSKTFIQKRGLPQFIAADPDGPIVYVATTLYEYGGHSRVILDYIRRQPDRNHVILLTGIAVRPNLAALKPMLDAYLPGIRHDLFVADTVRHDETAFWLLQQLVDLQPESIFLFGHPHDPVALAPVSVLDPAHVYFNHHADGCFSLGASLLEIAHIDQTPAPHHELCRATSGLKPIYIPQTLPDPGARDPAGFLPQRPLRTAVCGSHNKFMDEDYAYRYAEIVPQILAQTGGEHLHIGELPDAYLAHLHGHLKQKGIAAERFRYIPHVLNLAGSLGELDVDLYLTSFPGGGGKAAIEAMACGTPILCHINYRSRFASGVAEMVYPDAWFWRNAFDLITVLQSITREDLERHSRQARAYFESHHTEEALMQAYRGGRPIGMPAPPLRDYRPDPVQRTLDRLRQPIRK